MKHLIFIVTIVLFSCNTEKSNDQDRYDSELTPSQRLTVEADEEWNKDQIEDFMREAAMIDQMQIRVGNMAQKKAVNESIKIYGKLLVDDHTHSLNNLKELAQIQQIDLPDTLNQEHQQKISELESSIGAAFERKFLRMMIEGHIKDIEKYRTAQKSIQEDHEIKKWIDETLPALHRHQQKGEQLQQAGNEGDT